ncbi:protein of unknown function [Candidatus Nitrosocosmicus franklandus]|uniref:Uncharacterized protein n=1 Tax=Candidatus Nitrosocosmicus franklandianus TaxID=1798806 RepID=A0A484I5M2_9ARCH|nr:protein of unknown function [Candidatus Nitrosocosmicus franklandus]
MIEVISAVLTLILRVDDLFKRKFSTNILQLNKVLQIVKKL